MRTKPSLARLRCALNPVPDRMARLAIAATALACLPVASVSAADGRAYEMISPPDKGGFPLDLRAVTKSTPDGDGVAYAATGAFGDAESSQVFTYYVARRSGAGWSSRSAAAPMANGSGRYLATTRAFSESLDRTMQFSDAALTPGATAESGHLYRSDVATGRRTLVATDSQRLMVAENTLLTFGQYPATWATSDLSSYVFTATGSVVPGVSGSQQVYQVVGDEVQVASRLPDGTIPTGGAELAPNSNQDFIDAHRSLSEDGRRVFFRAPLDWTGALYMRLDGTTTVPLSVSRVDGAPTTPQPATFIGASEDGTIVYFWSGAQLTDDADNTGFPLSNIYRLDTTTDTMTNVARRLEPDADAILQTGVVYSVSADGSSLYFQARNKLTPDAELDSYQVYRYEHGEGLSLVVKHGLAQKSVGTHTSRSGRFFAFPLFDRVGEFDNTDPDCQPMSADSDWLPSACLEVYVYDGVKDELQCATCANASGDNHQSFPTLRVGVAADYKSRAVLDDGTVYFESFEALVPEDVNGVRDVYRWRVGEGASLVSSGRDRRDSYFADATADGESVFFQTSERLVAVDVDEERDLYVARVGGGIAAQDVAPAKDPVCEGDSCQGALDAGPLVSSIGSLGLAGAGDGQRPVAVRARVSLVRGSARGGSFSVRVRASGRGRIVVSGAGLRSRSRRVSAGASSRLRLSLNRSAERKLARRGRLGVTARVVFVSASGQRSVSRVSVTLRSNGGKSGLR